MALISRGFLQHFPFTWDWPVQASCNKSETDNLKLSCLHNLTCQSHIKYQQRFFVKGGISSLSIIRAAFSLPVPCGSGSLVSVQMGNTVEIDRQENSWDTSLALYTTSLADMLAERETDGIFYVLGCHMLMVWGVDKSHQKCPEHSKINKYIYK